MAFLGKEYKLVSQENFEAFLDTLGSEVKDDLKKVLLSHKPTAKLSKNGAEYTLSSSNPDNTVTELKFKDGVEFEEFSRSRPAKTTITVNGNTVTQVQKFEPQGATITLKREYNGDDMVLSITTSGWDGVARRFYKA